jgi:hypothetical protein
MGRNGTGVILRQDKEQFRVSRKRLIFRGHARNTPSPQCSAFLLRCWPLLVAVISHNAAAIALRLGLGLNVSRSAPSGVDRSVADLPAVREVAELAMPLEAIWHGDRMT